MVQEICSLACDRFMIIKSLENYFGFMVHSKKEILAIASCDYFIV